MALANISMLVISLAMALFGVCFGSLYEVGDSNGWTYKGVNYESWASTKNFTVGDVLNFKYARKENNVVRVFHRDFKSCNPKQRIDMKRTGNDYILLNRPGNFFFISSVNGHCHSGQKVHVSVSKSVPSLSPGPAPSPSLVPSSSPNFSPNVSPTSSPTSSPTASPTSPIATPNAAPTATPNAAPTIAPKTTPTASPKTAPTAAPKAGPTASPKAGPTAAPKAGPTAPPTAGPTVDGPPIADSPPDLPVDLVPAPTAAPPSPHKKSSAPSIHSSMPVLMAVGVIAYFVV